MPVLARGRRVGFAVGDLGFNLVWQSIELYLLFFYTEVLNLPLAWAAAIFFIGAVVDFVADPVIGALADRTAARTGRVRDWLLVAAPVVGVALPLAFSGIDVGAVALGAWALATHLVLRVSYSCGNIPYAALTARITDDAREQARLTGLRMQCAAFGGLVVATTYAFVPGITGGGDPSRFLLGAGLLGLLLQPFLLVTWCTTRERVAPSAMLAPFSLAGETRAMLGLLRRGARLRRVLGVVVFAGLATSLLGKSILFLFVHDLLDREAGFFGTFVPPLALLVCAPLWVRLSDRIGRAQTLVGAAVLLAGSMLLFALAAGVGAPLGASLPLLVLGIVATTGLSVMFWAMVPGTVPEAAGDHGDSEARVFAMATTARKFAQALASPLLALGLIVTRELTGRELAAPMLALVAILCAAALFRLGGDLSGGERDVANGEGKPTR